MKFLSQEKHQLTIEIETQHTINREFSISTINIGIHRKSLKAKKNWELVVNLLNLNVVSLAQVFLRTGNPYIQSYFRNNGRFAVKFNVKTAMKKIKGNLDSIVTTARKA